MLIIGKIEGSDALWGNVLKSICYYLDVAKPIDQEMVAIELEFAAHGSRRREPAMEGHTGKH